MSAVKPIMIATLMGCCWVCTSCSQTLSPYSEFRGLTDSELSTLQGKLTVLGPRERGLRTRAFDATGHSLDLSVFRPFYRSQFTGAYTMDFGSPVAFKASIAELAGIVDSVDQVSTITDGGVDPGAAVSFSLSVVKGGEIKVFESVLDTSDCRILLGRLLAALPLNQPGTDAIAQFACSLGLVPGPIALDVTSSTSIIARGFRKDRFSGQYVGSVRVTNTSAQPIPAPIILAFQPGENVTLANGSGFTCAAFPPRPYVLLMATSSLEPGGHVEVVLRFDNPDGERIALEDQNVYAGPGFH